MKTIETDIIAGQVIGSCTCDGCKQPVDVKVNTRKGVYYYCTRILTEHDGKKERCMTRLNFGRTASREILRDYLEDQQTKEVNHVPADEKEPEPKPAGSEEHPAGNGDERPSLAEWLFGG